MRCFVRPNSCLSSFLGGASSKKKDSIWVRKKVIEETVQMDEHVVATLTLEKLLFFHFVLLILNIDFISFSFPFDFLGQHGPNCGALVHQKLIDRPIISAIHSTRPLPLPKHLFFASTPPPPLYPVYIFE